MCNDQHVRMLVAQPIHVNKPTITTARLSLSNEGGCESNCYFTAPWNCAIYTWRMTARVGAGAIVLIRLLVLAELLARRLLLALALLRLLRREDGAPRAQQRLVLLWLGTGLRGGARLRRRSRDRRDRERGRGSAEDAREAYRRLLQARLFDAEACKQLMEACPIAHGISAACLVVLDDAKASPASGGIVMHASNQHGGCDGHVIDGFVGCCMHATDA